MNVYVVDSIRLILLSNLILIQEDNSVFYSGTYRNELKFINRIIHRVHHRIINNLIIFYIWPIEQYELVLLIYVKSYGLLHI